MSEKTYDESTYHPDGSFNWHNLSRDYNDILSWLIPTIIAEEKPTVKTKDLVSTLSDATDKFTKVKIEMTVNGVSVNGAKLIIRLWEAMQDQANQRAKKMIEEFVYLNEAEEIFRETMRAAQESLIRKLKDSGFDIRLNDIDNYDLY